MADLRKAAPDAVRSVAALPASVIADLLAAIGAGQPEEPRLAGPGILVKDTFYPVRTLNAQDTGALYRFLQEGLSEESRLRRFMSPMPKVSPSAAAWLADRDGHDRVALAALDPKDPTIVIAVVEYAFSAEGPPEVAVAVADAYQGRGIGTNLLRMLANMSLAAGQPVWKCDVLADNDGPLRLLAVVGDVELGTVSGGVRSLTVTLDPDRLQGTTIV